MWNFCILIQISFARTYFRADQRSLKHNESFIALWFPHHHKFHSLASLIHYKICFNDTVSFNGYEAGLINLYCLTGEGALMMRSLIWNCELHVKTCGALLSGRWLLKLLLAVRKHIVTVPIAHSYSTMQRLHCKTIFSILI